MHNKDSQVVYVPGKAKDPETFRSMAMAWCAKKSPTEAQDPKPMNMPILQTYPMANQVYYRGNAPYQNNCKEYAPTRPSVARDNKYGYSNSNSNPNSNSKYFSLNNSSTGKRCIQAPGRPSGGGAETAVVVEKEKEKDIFCDVCVEEIPYEPTLDEIMGGMVRRLGLRESNMIWVELGLFYRELGWKLCDYAIGRAEREGKPRWSYVRGVLKRLKTNKIRTTEEAEAFEKQRREEMGLIPRP